MSRARPPIHIPPTTIPAPTAPTIHRPAGSSSTRAVTSRDCSSLDPPPSPDPAAKARTE